MNPDGDYAGYGEILESLSQENEQLRAQLEEVRLWLAMGAEDGTSPGIRAWCRLALARLGKNQAALASPEART